MSMEYIRRFYNIPAKRGMIVTEKETGYKAVITSSKGEYLRVCGSRFVKGGLYHPMDFIYPEADKKEVL
jgi:hypothetical protein